jgi:hypothetical protein
VPPLERTISVLPAGTGRGQPAGAGIFAADRMIRLPVSAAGSQASTRYCGRQHAVQSKAAQTAAALVARGHIGRNRHHRDQRAQRPGIMDRQPRRRQAGAETLERCQSALALCLPQRLRDRILAGQRIRQRGRRAMADPGTAIEPAEARFAAWPAESRQRKQRPERREPEQADPDGARDKRQRQPQSGPGHHQKQSGDAQQPRQMRPGQLPRDRVSGPLQGLAQMQPRGGIGIARGF